MKLHYLIVSFLIVCSRVLQITGVPFSDSQPKDVEQQLEEQKGDQDVMHDYVLYVRDDVNDTTKYLVIDDMIIKKDASKSGLINAAWPNSIVPYMFALTVVPQQRATISQAMTELSTRTCVQFRPAKQDDAYWLLFQNDPLSQGCWSYVGWQNRRNQPLQFSPECSKGNAVHEIIHALGFYHEHTRNDRDDYVTVHYDNVMQGQTRNFLRENQMDPPPETTTYTIPYNYDSIMHYGKYYFSKNSQPTVDALFNPTALGSGSNIGQREFLSYGDLEMINRKYNCPTISDVEDGVEGSKPTPPPAGGNPVCHFPSPFPICRLMQSRI